MNVVSHRTSVTGDMTASNVVVAAIGEMIGTTGIWVEIGRTMILTRITGKTR